MTGASNSHTAERPSQKCSCGYPFAPCHRTQTDCAVFGPNQQQTASPYDLSPNAPKEYPGE